MDILEALKEKIGCRDVEAPISWSLGGLNQTAVVKTDRGSFFIKRHPSYDLSMYQAEYAGLLALKESDSILVPTPYHYDQSADGVYILMEYLELMPHDSGSMHDLGESIAKLHRCSAPDKFGFAMDNTIGTTPQINTWTDDWVTFFLTHRLDYQLQLIEEHYQDSALRKEAEGVLQHFPEFFAGLDIKPCLLHGDLWGGNTGRDKMGRGVIYDPAVYYGHHEAEFGIITMFGGFSKEFFEAYNSLIPKHPGFEERVDIYRLYHTLNHYNLFGTSYRDSCLTLCRRYC